MICPERSLMSARCTVRTLLSICSPRMKNILTMLLINAVVMSSTVTGANAAIEWTWMGGTQGPLRSGVYETKGVASATARPGARSGHALTKDAAGNIWIFGGFGISAGGSTPQALDGSGLLNDLWKRDASTGFWTWMAGSIRSHAESVHGAIGESGPDYMPAARDNAALWYDNAGNIWMFGGSNHSDVWKFNPVSAEWAWMSGADTRNQLPHHGTLGVAHTDNTPGAREPAAYWSDNDGNLWIFGGYGTYEDPESSFPEYGAYNDLWKYDTASNEWVWVDGPSEPLQYANFGTMGVPSADNLPGSRSRAAFWRDSNGDFWLFGGSGRNATDSGMLGDMWKYDVGSGQWTWVGGIDTTYTNGVFGTKGVAHADNRPGTLQQPTGWADDAGNFWVFGGYGSMQRTNALWKYDSDTEMWTWMAGGSDGNEVGVYGTLGVPDAANAPGAREASVGWADANGDVWIFGGNHASRSMYGYSDLWRFDTSVNAWAWEGGESAAIYNTSWEEGSPRDDVLPEAAYSPAEWSDKNGNLWLYQGPDTANIWKYNTSLRQWAWVKGSKESYAIPEYGDMGVADSDNTPGGREAAASWTDKNGNFWLFGGSVLIDQFLVTNRPRRNDLWKFDPDTENWTWVHGHTPPISTDPEYGEMGVADETNIPGGREKAATWVDNAGNLWLFGGYGFGNNTSSIGWLNDLWKYDIATGMWTWISGDDTINDFGIYGNRGEPHPATHPGGRENAMTWIDNQGNLWLMGGYGYATPGIRGTLNDLWKFNISTGEWTWMHGSNDRLSPGEYGSIGISAPGNMPPSRTGGATWTTADGRFWLFGGTTDPFYGWPAYNDLWVYDPSTGQWTWQHGSNSLDQRGIYGELQVSDPGNVPGARNSAATWTDSNGNFWLFGGTGFGVTDLYRQQDLWHLSVGEGLVIPTAAQDWELYE